MKVTFLTPPPLDNKPPAERIYGCNYGLYHQPNIFTLGLVSLLEREGHEVHFMDYSARRDGGEKFLEFAEEDDSDVVVFYSVFLSRNTDLAARGMLRGNAVTVFIGPDPTLNPGLYLQENSVVVRGEPELTVLELFKSLDNGRRLEGIRGISYLGGRVRNNPPRELIENLDLLPFPARDKAKNEEYCNPKLRRKPMTVMSTSRGCSHRCWMCVPNSLSFAREVEWKQWFGRKPPARVRSAESVIKEFESIADAGYRAVSIIDDEFLWGRERTLRICEGIRDLGVEWGCLARADRLQDEAVVKAMAEANCVYVDIGVESFIQEILDYIKKDLRVEAVYRAVRLLKNHGIQVKLNLLLGSCPLETEETIQRSIEEAIRLDADGVMLSIATPFPGTEFYDAAREHGWMVTPRYVPIDPSRESLISYPHLSKERLEELLRQGKRKFYLRPRYLLKTLLSPRNLLWRTKVGKEYLFSRE